jgi:hypothetical protein
MAKNVKKPYTKPKLTAQKIKLGVYGDYCDQGDVVEPFSPIGPRYRGGDSSSPSA